MPSYDALQAVSVDDPTWFWTTIADELGIRWRSRPAMILDESDGSAFARWFPGGRLNAAETLLDHSGMALIEENEDLQVSEVSYDELAARVWSVAASLRGMGIRPGDRVGLMTEFGIDGVVALIAVIAVGAIAVPMFSGFAAGAVATRLKHCGARIFMLQEQIRHSGLVADTSGFARELNQFLPHLMIYRFRAITPASHNGVEFEVVDSEAPAMICYTSGTTGAPKAAVHVHGGFLIRSAMEGRLSFNLAPDRRFLWPSDIGWVVAAWQIVFVLSVGATLVVLPGSPRYLPDRVLSAARRHSVYALGVSPSLVRSWLDRSTVDPLPDLSLVAVSGEPLDLESWRWLDRHVCDHKRPILNCSGGTEVGGALFMPPLTEDNPAGSVGKPALGIRPDVLDGEGKPCEPGERGELVIRRPWPSMSRGLYLARDRYLETYWAKYPHVWAHGDWVSRDSTGHWFVHGRTDDVIKVAGRRIDPGEVEAVIAQLESISEVAVVAVPDAVKGSRLKAAIVPAVGHYPDASEIQRHVVRVLGKAYRPEEIAVVDSLPRTETGKVQRRQVRSE